MKKHQYRTSRNYQYPNAAVTIPDKQHIGNVGYVVNMLHQTKLYGVVKYVIDGDRIGWLESPTHFNTDVQKAEEWVRATLQNVATGVEPKDNITYLFKSLNNTEEIRQFELDLINNTLVVHGYDFNQVLTFSSLDELKHHLEIVDHDGYKAEK